MNKSAILALASLWLLASCATVGKPPTDPATGNTSSFRWSLVYGRTWTPPNPNYPKLSIQNDSYIVVDQEPIFINQQEQNSIWFVVDPGSKYYFVEKDPVRFDPPRPTDLKCDRTEDPRIVVCTFKKTKRAKYPYQVTLTNGVKTIQSDPTMMTD
jgi:hypothetical protein